MAKRETDDRNGKKKKVGKGQDEKLGGLGFPWRSALSWEHKHEHKPHTHTHKYSLT